MYSYDTLNRVINKEIKISEGFLACSKFGKNISLTKLTLLMWKMTFPWPRGTGNEGKMCNFIIEFPLGFPDYPADIYCTDNVDHPFLSVGNRMPLDIYSWSLPCSETVHLTMIITGIYRLFMISRPQPSVNWFSNPSQEDPKERTDLIRMPMCAIDMYCDVIMNKSESDKVPRAAATFFKSVEFSNMRKKTGESNKYGPVCVCEICQLDKEIRELEAKEKDIFAAIQDCKKMLQDNQNLTITN